MNLTMLLTAELPPAPEVTIRGVTVRPRPLTLREAAAVRESFPRPIPPLVKDPAKGSLAPKIPDEQDPEYRRACQANYYAVLVAEAAIAVGWTTGGAGFKADAAREDRDAWLRAASTEIAGVLTEPELAAIGDALARADRDLEAAARRGLIVALGDDAKADDDEEEALPENYGQTRLYALLRACERFGLDPTKALLDMAPADKTLLRQYDRARRQEEDKRDAVLIRAGAARV